VKAAGSPRGIKLVEVALDANNVIVAEMYELAKGPRKGQQVFNLRVFTRKLYSKGKDGKKVFLTKAQLRDDPAWVPAGGFVVGRAQAVRVLPMIIEAAERAAKLWDVKLEEEEGAR